MNVEVKTGCVNKTTSPIMYKSDKEHGSTVQINPLFKWACKWESEPPTKIMEKYRNDTIFTVWSRMAHSAAQQNLFQSRINRVNSNSNQEKLLSKYYCWNPAQKQIRGTRGQLGPKHHAKSLGKVSHMKQIQKKVRHTLFQKILHSKLLGIGTDNWY